MSHFSVCETVPVSAGCLASIRSSLTFCPSRLSAQAKMAALICDRLRVRCLDGYWGMRVTSEIAFPEACDNLRVKTQNAQISLWILYVRSVKFLTTDPRDKIFALRSLIVDDRQRAAMDHLIDYSQSVERIFMNTTFFLLPVIGLRVLCAIRHPHGMAMPSWIPDFSQTVPRQDQHSPMNLYDSECLAAMLKSSRRSGGFYEVVLDAEVALLKVLGIRLSEIRCRSPVLSFKGVQDAKDQLQDLYKSLPNLLYSDFDTSLPEDGCVTRNLDAGLLDGEYFHEIDGGFFF
jgi:hypothetical protein